MFAFRVIFYFWHLCNVLVPFIQRAPVIPVISNTAAQSYISLPAPGGEMMFTFQVPTGMCYAWGRGKLASP